MPSQSKDTSSISQLEKTPLPAIEEDELPTPLFAWVVLGAASLYYHIATAFLSCCGFFRNAIVASVGGSEKALWLANCYLIVIIVLGPAFSRIGDTCGRRYLVLFGALMGVISGIIIATAQSMDAAIAGATLFGLAFGQVSNTYAVACEMVSRHQRGTANAIMAVGAASGSVAGLLIGAAFITNEPGGFTGWRSLFWYMTAVFALSGFLFAVLYFPVAVPNPEGLSIWRRIHRSVDIPGTVLLGLAITPLILGLVWGGVVYSWSSAAVLVPLICGIVLCLVFAAHQTYFEKDGLLSHKMFANRNFPIALYGCLVEGMLYLVFNAYGGEEITLLYETRIILSTTRYAAFPIAICVANPIYAVYVYRYKRVFAVLLTGYILMLGSAIGFACLTRTTSDTSTAMLVLAGLGFAGPQTFLTTVIQLAVPPEYLGLASALSQCARLLGGAIGIACTGAIFTSKITKRLPSNIETAALANGLPQTSLGQFVSAMAEGEISVAEAIPGVTDTIVKAAADATKDAYAYSLKFIWIFVIPFIAIALLANFFLHPVRKLMNSIVDRPVKGVAARLKQERQHHQAFP